MEKECLIYILCMTIGYLLRVSDESLELWLEGKKRENESKKDD